MKKHHNEIKMNANKLTFKNTIACKINKINHNKCSRKCCPDLNLRLM